MAAIWIARLSSSERAHSREFVCSCPTSCWAFPCRSRRSWGSMSTRMFMFWLIRRTGRAVLMRWEEWRVVDVIYEAYVLKCAATITTWHKSHWTNSRSPQRMSKPSASSTSVTLASPKWLDFPSYTSFPKIQSRSMHSLSSSRQPSQSERKKCSSSTRSAHSMS